MEVHFSSWLPFPRRQAILFANIAQRQRCAGAATPKTCSAKSAPIHLTEGVPDTQVGRASASVKVVQRCKEADGVIWQLPRSMWDRNTPALPAC